jgi:hypothetical protein
MSSSNSNRNTATVRFDVGGTIYRVSRLLLEQHPNTMLARMVSKTWLCEEEDNERKDEPLFIDRDGERFRYVLDFMRDGPNVSLPVTVSKEGFLKDLDYFGFDSVNPNDISMCSSYTSKKMDELETKGEMEDSCANLAHYCFFRFKTSNNPYDILMRSSYTAKEMDELETKDEMEDKCANLAHYCFFIFKTSNNSLVVDIDERHVERFYRSEHMKFQGMYNFVNNEQDKACLNKYLNEYGLKVLRVEFTVGVFLFHFGIADKSS